VFVPSRTLAHTRLPYTTLFRSRAHRLTILQAEKHQILSQWDVIPILVLDVWEHAYYLQYKTNKDKYVDNWWNVVNWDHVTNYQQDRKSTRLNSSHVSISYAVFC